MAAIDASISGSERVFVGGEQDAIMENTETLEMLDEDYVDVPYGVAPPEQTCAENVSAVLPVPSSSFYDKVTLVDVNKSGW